MAHPPAVVLPTVRGPENWVLGNVRHHVIDKLCCSSFIVLLGTVRRLSPGQSRAAVRWNIERVAPKVGEACRDEHIPAGDVVFRCVPFLRSHGEQDTSASSQ